MPILPYMRQLPQDYARKLIQAPVVPYVPPPEPPVISPIPVEDIAAPATGAVFYGNTPPADPQLGWLWVNPANNGLYMYADPGVWQQVGTNW